MNGNAADPREEWTRFAPPPLRLADSYRWHVFLSYRSVSRLWVVKPAHNEPVSPIGTVIGSYNELSNPQ